MTILSYFVKRRMNTECKNERITKTRYEKIMLSSMCVVCYSKQSKFIRKKRPVDC